MIKIRCKDNETIIDDDLCDAVNKYTWFPIRKHKVTYAITSIYDNRNKKTNHLYLHRLIFNLKNKSAKIIDHINGDGLDNRIENLRGCSHAQNITNMRRCTSGETSKYKGVHYRKDRKKWRAYIVKNYKQISLGSFSSELEAVKAYNNGAAKYFGEFASLNHI